MTTRSDQTAIYEHRLQSITTLDCPPFFLQIKYIKAAFATTQVWNMLASHDDFDRVAQELKNAINASDLRQFYLSAEDNSLLTNQQIAIVQLNNTFNNYYKSLLLSGFSTSTIEDHMTWHDDYPIQQSVDEHTNNTGAWEFQTEQYDSSMKDEDINDRFHDNMNLTTTTVSTYIQRHFISGNDTPIFAHVHDPICGTREDTTTFQRH
jgi:hypothetical protein